MKHNNKMSDFLFRNPLVDIDPNIYDLNSLEEFRQYNKIILIASESTAPRAVREALNSPFNNLYAEGYPSESSRHLTENEIVDYKSRLSHYRRYSNPRYYKGVEYCDTVESLARHRGANLFANKTVNASDIYLNVQPLSGAAANNAVYHALLDPGDTIMGLKLTDGGHLSHGAKVNRSGKLYNSIPYPVDSSNEKIDYQNIQDLALTHKPKLIIAGYSSYPWSVDWKALRQIADKVNAMLLADISHVAGLVTANQYPSPVGFADVVTFTTHKSLCGPRGACILTTDKALARQIDRAVFPGEQGGPHINSMAAIAVAFKLAGTTEFETLQKQICKNAARMSDKFHERGFRIPYGGTNTHLVNIDCKSVTGNDGTPLMGDIASRILDVANIVVNRNTIPGDKSALNPSGLRLGTTWISQRGCKEKEVDMITNIIADTLLSLKPYRYSKTYSTYSYRAKIDFDQLNQTKIKTRNLAHNLGKDFQSKSYGYPHSYFIDQTKDIENNIDLEIKGLRSTEFLQTVTSNDVTALKVGHHQHTQITQGKVSTRCTLTRTKKDLFVLTVPGIESVRIKTWLRDLSDGYISLDHDDIFSKTPGPIAVTDLGISKNQISNNAKVISIDKPYFIGIESTIPKNKNPLPEFNFTDISSPKKLLKTKLFETHKSLGAKMVPFGGWNMPVWYSSVSEEHNAVRSAAGLFDVSHMGVWDARGESASEFLDNICGNDIRSLKIGDSLYTHFLDPDGKVIDDLLIYRTEEQCFLIVVNASNNAKNWKWVNAVKSGKVMIDRDRPWSKITGRRQVTIRNLRANSSGRDMLVDIALQGPNSKNILLALATNNKTKSTIQQLRRTKLCKIKINKYNLIVSRTGYTGEPLGYEIFVHPDDLIQLWNSIIKVGKPYGLLPCGLASRDSTRTEAGLPLYGHEIAGDLNITISESGFGSYIKTYKPWFIGRKSYINSKDRGKIVRFRFDNKGVRMAHLGDPVVDKRGKVIGKVTSCAIDSNGLLLGQALIIKNNGKVGNKIGIFQSANNKSEKSKVELDYGDKVTLHESATILPRFMKKT